MEQAALASHVTSCRLLFVVPLFVLLAPWGAGRGDREDVALSYVYANSDSNATDPPRVSLNPESPTWGDAEAFSEGKKARAMGSVDVSDGGISTAIASVRDDGTDDMYAILKYDGKASAARPSKASPLQPCLSPLPRWRCTAAATDHQRLLLRRGSSFKRPEAARWTRWPVHSAIRRHSVCCSGAFSEAPWGPP